MANDEHPWTPPSGYRPTEHQPTVHCGVVVDRNVCLSVCVCVTWDCCAVSVRAKQIRIRPLTPEIIPRALFPHPTSPDCPLTSSVQPTAACRFHLSEAKAGLVGCSCLGRENRTKQQKLRRSPSVTLLPCRSYSDMNPKPKTIGTSFFAAPVF